jgi:diguanylate cyclase (GGDEF)-like protein
MNALMTWFGVRSKAVVACALCYAVLVLVVAVVQPGSASTAIVVLFLAELLVSLVALVGGFVRARRSSGIERLTWCTMTGFAASTAAVLVISAAYQAQHGTAIPIPSFVDVFWLLSYSLGAAFALLVGFGGTSSLTRWRVLLDGSLIAVSVLFVSWALVLGPLYRTRGVDSVPDVVWLAYPVLDVVFVTVSLLAMRRPGGGRRPAVLLVACGALLLGIADSYVAATSQGTAPTPLAVAAYCIGIAATTLTVFLPGGIAVDGAEEPQSRTQLVLPYVPTTAALLIAVALALGGQDLDAGLVMLGATVLLLLLTRQFLALLDNFALAGRLAVTIAELERSQAELRYQAQNDPLTSLFNRRYMEAYLDRHDAAGPGRLAVLFLDLNDFKPANDRLGHDTGDAILVEVAVRLRRCVRNHDVLVRLGGDEFAVLLEDAGDDATVEALAARVSDDLRQVYEVNGHVVPLSASVGYAVQEGTEGFNELLRRADLAMYAAKRNGDTHLRFRQEAFSRQD